MLVQPQPIAPQLTDDRSKLVEIDRFADKAVGSQLITSPQVMVFFRRSQNHHAYERGARVGADAAEYFDPVHPRQLEI